MAGGARAGVSRLGRLMAGVVLAGALLGTALQGARWLTYRLYPFPYRETVVREARARGEDPLMLAAIIRVESKWDPGATSRKGARGLMQVMPETGDWAAGRLGLAGYHADQLYAPEVSIRIGSWYFDHLQGVFGGSQVLALAAYNGGTGRVKEWLAGQEWSGEWTQIDRIPYPETRDFVRRVLTDYRRYRMLYDADGNPRWR